MVTTYQLTRYCSESFYLDENRDFKKRTKEERENIFGKIDDVVLSECEKILS